MERRSVVLEHVDDRQKIAWCISGQLKSMGRVGLQYTLAEFTKGGCVDFYMSVDLYDNSSIAKDGCSIGATPIEEANDIIRVLKPIKFVIRHHEIGKSGFFAMDALKPEMQHRVSCIKMIREVVTTSEFEYKYVVFSRPELKIINSTIPSCCFWKDLPRNKGYALNSVDYALRTQKPVPINVCPFLPLYAVGYDASLLYLNYNFSDNYMGVKLREECISKGRGSLGINSTYAPCDIPECLIEQMVYNMTGAWEGFPFDVKYKLIRNKDAFVCGKTIAV